MMMHEANRVGLCDLIYARPLGSDVDGPSSASNKLDYEIVLSPKQTSQPSSC